MYEVKNSFRDQHDAHKSFSVNQLSRDQARGYKKNQAQLSRALSSVLLTRKPKTKDIIYIFFGFFLFDDSSKCLYLILNWL